MSGRRVGGDAPRVTESRQSRYRKSRHRLYLWLTDGEWTRLQRELARKHLTPTEWFREALAQSERERILRGSEFLRLEIQEEPLRLAEEALAKEAEGWLFSAERLSGKRPQDLLERRALQQRAAPFLEAASYFSALLTKFQRQRDVIKPTEIQDPHSLPTSPRSAQQTAGKQVHPPHRLRPPGSAEPNP